MCKCCAVAFGAVRCHVTNAQEHVVGLVNSGRCKALQCVEECHYCIGVQNRELTLAGGLRSEHDPSEVCTGQRSGPRSASSLWGVYTRQRVEGCTSRRSCVSHFLLMSK